MLDVIIALIPALAWSVYVFGFRALAVTLVSVCSCVVFEFLYRKLMHKSDTIGDLFCCCDREFCLLFVCPPLFRSGWW